MDEYNTVDGYIKDESHVTVSTDVKVSYDNTGMFNTFEPSTAQFVFREPRTKLLQLVIQKSPSKLINMMYLQLQLPQARFLVDLPSFCKLEPCYHSD